MKVKAKDIKLGMLVDLEGDKYADPKHNHLQFKSELQEVCQIDRETSECICIWFEGWDGCGFPLEHELEVRSWP